MNSIEALDSALLVLRNRQRRLHLEDGGHSAEVIQTLADLRQAIADMQEAEAHHVSDR